MRNFPMLKTFKRIHSKNCPEYFCGFWFRKIVCEFFSSFFFSKKRTKFFFLSGFFLKIAQKISCSVFSQKLSQIKFIFWFSLKKSPRRKFSPVFPWKFAQKNFLRYSQKLSGKIFQPFFLEKSP